MNLKIMNFQVGGCLIYFLGVRQISPIGRLTHLRSSQFRSVAININVDICFMA